MYHFAILSDKEYTYSSILKSLMTMYIVCKILNCARPDVCITSRTAISSMIMLVSRHEIGMYKLQVPTK